MLERWPQQIVMPRTSSEGSLEEERSREGDFQGKGKEALRLLLMREPRMQRQLGGNTSQEGRYPPPPLEVLGTRGRGIYREPVEQNNCQSRPTTPAQHWSSSSTWSCGSGTRSSPGCPTGSAWLPAPACPARSSISASRSSSPRSVAGSRWRLSWLFSACERARSPGCCSWGKSHRLKENNQLVLWQNWFRKYRSQ